MIAQSFPESAKANAVNTMILNLICVSSIFEQSHIKAKLERRIIVITPKLNPNGFNSTNQPNPTTKI